MKILFCAAEVEPFAKSGGLADVAGALPKALSKLGHEVVVVMPRYYGIDKELYNLRQLPTALGVGMGSMGQMFAGVFEGTMPNSSVRIYFIEHEGFFGRKGLYDQDGKAYDDNDIRFVFFSVASMQLAKYLRFHPDVIHANDWHTASIPLLLNTRYAFDEDFAFTGALFSIHNMQHQGKFGKSIMDVLAVGWEHFNAREIEEFDGVNFIKGAIVHADAINTVSPTYAQEIQTPAFGWGLDGLLRQYSYKLSGILNGVDYTQWSPQNDTYIKKTYDIDTLEDKKINKKALQEEFGLPVRDEVPLVGFVGRLDAQKGIELVAQSIHALLAHDVHIVLLGTGQGWAEHFFSQISAQYAHKFACYIGYRNDIAHRIEAGSDIFLMPSLFEPCGLNQIYSLRYGTLPLVRATGGLEDTVQNYDATTRSGTGFKFYDATQHALEGTFAWAVDVWYNDHEGFKAMQQNAMRARFDYAQTAKEYERVYARIIQGRKGL